MNNRKPSLQIRTFCARINLIIQLSSKHIRFSVALSLYKNASPVTLGATAISEASLCDGACLPDLGMSGRGWIFWRPERLKKLEDDTCSPIPSWSCSQCWAVGQTIQSTFAVHQLTLQPIIIMAKGGPPVLVSFIGLTVAMPLHTVASTEAIEQCLGDYNRHVGRRLCCNTYALINYFSLARNILLVLAPLLRETRRAILPSRLKSP